MNDPWIRVEAYCEKYPGESPNTIQKRVHDGVWERGVHYSCPEGGQGYVHEQRARAWVNNKSRRKS